MESSFELEAGDLHAAIGEARSIAREQVLAAWQVHIDRVREQLESGWREAVDEIFEQRFSEVESRLRKSFEAAVNTRAHLVKAAAARGLTEQLNGIVRSMKQAETREIWIHTLLEAAGGFCSRAAFFLVTPTGLRFEGATGGTVANSIAADIPLTSAPAFTGAIESRETLVAAGTSAELSLTVSNLLGDAAERKVFLFPLVFRQETVAVVYADPGDRQIDVSALELLTSLAAGSVEMTGRMAAKAQPEGLVHIAPVEAPPPAPKSSWADLSKSEQEVHLRAQRFARTEVAQLLLHKVNQVRGGRASMDLYGALREDIDAGREAFRQRFIETCPSMVDYYHLELVRTLAKDHVDSLGPDYPGALGR